MAANNNLLLKHEVEAGAIFWLRKDANKCDAEAYGRSGLDDGALHHPMLILRTLRSDHDFVWACIVSQVFFRSTYGMLTENGIDDKQAT